MSRYFVRFLFLVLPVLFFSDIWAAPVRLSIGVFTGKPGESVAVPILIEGATGQDVLAFKIVLLFNPTILTFKAVSVKGTVVENWGRPVVNPQEDRITMVGGGITSIANDGTLLIVSFDVLPEATIGGRSSLSFTQVRLNEGIPEAVTTNGSLMVLGEGQLVHISAGAVSGKNGEMVTLPVSISGVSGNGILSFKIVMTHDPKIVTLKETSFEGTVSAEWGKPVVTMNDGEITLSGSGTAPLNQDGILMNVRFEIVSDAVSGSRSSVSLKEAGLNEGKIKPTTSDGEITVSAPLSGLLTLSVGEVRGEANDSVAVPLFISGTQGRDILAFKIVLRYNDRLSTPVDVVSPGTVTEGWPSPIFKAERDTLSIAAAGVSPIERDGELIRLIFTISPKAERGMKGPLWILTTAFESLTQSGEYSATTQNGMLVVVASDSSTAVEEEEDVSGAGHPDRYSLEQNFPNPFNLMTMIRYSLPAPAGVRLAIYDTTGRLVRTLQEGYRHTGRYRVRWDGRDERGIDVAGGIYLCRMTSGRFTETRKMTLLK